MVRPRKSHVSRQSSTRRLHLCRCMVSTVYKMVQLFVSYLESKRCQPSVLRGSLGNLGTYSTWGAISRSCEYVGPLAYSELTDDISVKS